MIGQLGGRTGVRFAAEPVSGCGSRQFWEFGLSADGGGVGTVPYVELAPRGLSRRKMRFRLSSGPPPTVRLCGLVVYLKLLDGPSSGEQRRYPYLRKTGFRLANHRKGLERDVETFC